MLDLKHIFNRFKPAFKGKGEPGRSTNVLLIMDGFGIAPDSPGNAIAKAKTPTYDHLLATYPHGELIASGESVGLPANEVGNTEVGHLTLGAGRVVLQDVERIDKAIVDGNFSDNKAFLMAVKHLEKTKGKLHLLGLVSTGSVHSKLEHFFALLKYAKDRGINPYLHLITDGRDASPKEGINVVAKIEEQIATFGTGKIATVMGRYYAMDRDRRWERTKTAYQALVLGKGKAAASAKEAIEASYSEEKTDEFIEPVIIDKNGLIEDGDALIFFNFRIDRPRQLTMAFTLENFEKLDTFKFGYSPEEEKMGGEEKIGKTFDRERRVKDLFFVTMTNYQENLPVSAVAFGSEEVKMGLTETLSLKGKRQLRLAESEKERFISYYFDGLSEEVFKGEERVVIPSPKVPTYDKKPEMALPEVTKKLIGAIKEGKYDFIAVNFANADMVGHTGNLKAAILAVEAVDKVLKEAVEAVLATGGTVFITADHGNAEEMVEVRKKSFFFTAEKMVTDNLTTEHTNNPVPLIVVKKGLEGKSETLLKGALGDVAPTILANMGVEKPTEMTGRNLMEVTDK